MTGVVATTLSKTFAAIAAIGLSAASTAEASFNPSTDFHKKQAEITERIRGGLDASISGVGGESLKERRKHLEQQRQQQNSLLALHNSIQELEGLYEDLEEINSELAALELEKHKVQLEITKQEQLLAKQQEMESNKKAAQDKIEELNTQKKNNEVEQAKLQIEAAVAGVFGNKSHSDDCKRKVKELDKANKEMTKDLAKEGLRLNKLNEQLESFKASHPDIAGALEGLKEQFKEIEAKQATLEEKKAAKLEAIDAKQKELLANADPKDRAAMEENFNGLRCNLEKRERDNYAFKENLVDGIKDALEKEDTGLYNDLIGIAQTFFDKDLQTQANTLLDTDADLAKLEALQQSISANGDMTRSEFLEKNINNFESINLRHLLAEWAPGYHEGHTTVKDAKENDVYIGKDGPYTKEDGLITDTKQLINVYEQAYTGTPPKPFYNETSKAGDSLLEKYQNRNDFFDNTDKISALKETLEQTKEDTINAMKPEALTLEGITETCPMNWTFAQTQETPEPTTAPAAAEPTTPLMKAMVPS